MVDQSFDAIVVGAGVSGLTLARRLQDSGAKVLVLEKSRGLGGRLATRRDGDAAFDHGAQFYRVRDQAEPWAASGLTIDWFTKEGVVHRAAPGGLTRVAKYLAEPLTVVREEKVLTVDPDAGSLSTESGKSYRGSLVYLSSPVPQSVEILRRSGISYPAELDELHYHPALVGLFRVESDAPAIRNFRYAEGLSDSLLSLSNQQSKGVSESLAFTAVMSPEWSRARFEEEESSSFPALRERFEAYLNSLAPNYTVLRGQLKKWRYSHPVRAYGAPYLALAGGKVVLIGDGFGGPSVMGAVRSALAAPLK